MAEGHELGLHGYDHVGWQDRVHRIARAAVEADFLSAVAAYREILGHPPAASAAPGWRTTWAALEVQDGLGLRYASDVRGSEPFWPTDGVSRIRTLQVPTTLPTVDELLGRVRDIPAALEAALGPGLNVFTLHAEVEGGALIGEFERFLERQVARGVELSTLGDVAAHLLDTPMAHPLSPIVKGRVPGRSGWVTVQGALRTETQKSGACGEHQRERSAACLT